MGSYKAKGFTGSRRRTSEYYSSTAGGNPIINAINKAMKGYSKYGSEGKGLTDVATRAYAESVGMKYGSSSEQFKKATTFLNPFTGERIAKGSFQIVGMTAASLGFGTGMTGYAVTGDTGLTGYEFAAKYQQVGEKPTGEKLYFPRTTPGIPKPPKAARGMIGEQTTLYTPEPAGIGHALMGGMGRGEWERPQIKKEEAKSGGGGVGTVIALGGVGYILWSLLK